MRHTLALFTLCSASVFAGSPGGVDITTELVYPGGGSFGGITAIASSPDSPGFLMIGYRQGVVEILQDDAPVPGGTLVDIRGEVDLLAEGGLLGVALHPGFASNSRYFYLYTATVGGQGSTVIEERRVDEPGEPARRVAVFPLGAIIHKGGWIGFSPIDGFLYVALGDNGVSAAVQDLTRLNGKVLRLDMDGDDFPGDDANNYAIPDGNPFTGPGQRGEIWAYGLRNPYRASFDRVTGDLWLGDVGDFSREEIDRIPSGVGGLHFGWPCFEGTLPRAGSCAPNPTAPALDYQRGTIGSVVIGGCVYRGCAMPELDGRYFFSDLANPHLSSFALDEHGAPVDLLAGDDAPSSATLYTFGEDSSGELLLGTSANALLRIVPVVSPPDADGDGVPDSCESADACAGDCDGSGDVSFNDLVAMLFEFGGGASTPCDADGSGSVDFNDLVTALFLFGPCAG